METVWFKEQSGFLFAWYVHCFAVYVWQNGFWLLADEKADILTGWGRSFRGLSGALCILFAEELPIR